MKLDFKYTILYTLGSIFLFWILIKLGTSVCYNSIEGLTNFDERSQNIIPYPKQSEINYRDLNSPLYSHNVNLPINDPISCKNFCGPNAKCLLTGEQCTSDVDCFGCNPGPTTSKLVKEATPYDATGKLGQNLQYSSLTTGYNNHNADFAQLYEGSKDVQIKKPYQGVDLWTHSFNKGLELYNKKRNFADKYSEGVSQQIQDEEPDIASSKLSYYEPKYPLSVSATGQFFQTMPPASNASLS